MKKVLFALFMTFMFNSSFAYVVDVNTPNTDKDPNLSELMEGLENITIDDILTMTPKKYKQITGKRLGLKNSIKLKIAQKRLKKGTKTNAAIGKGLYVFLAIIGWGFLGMGLNDDWEGKDWIICLALGFFTCIGGLIYALVKKKKYY